MTADIEFICSHCGQQIAAEPGAAGLMVDCPSCARPLTIPVYDRLGALLVPSVPEIVLSRPASSPRLRPRSLRLEEEIAILPGTELSAEDAGEPEVLQEVITGLRAENERLKASLTHAEAEMKTSHNERLAARTDLAYLKHRVSSQEILLAEGERELEKSRGVSRSVSADLETACEWVAQLQAEAAQRDTELVELRSHLTAAETESAKQRTALTEAVQQLNAGEARLQTLTARNAASLSEIKNLRRLLHESHADAELTGVRAKLAETESEGAKLRAAVAHLEEEVRSGVAEHHRLEGVVEEMGKRLQEAADRALESGETDFRQDNEVLRGIVARQNGELEHRYRDLIRLKRARIALRIVYGLLGLALLALGYLALLILPNLTWDW